MKKTLAVLLLALTPALARGQVDVRPEMDPNKARPVVRIAVPFPDLTVPATAPSGAVPVDAEVVREAFFGSLTRDIAYSGVLAIAPLPPNVPITVEVAKNAKADLLLTTTVYAIPKAGALTYIVEARLFNMTGALETKPRQYSGVAAALGRTAHTLANDILRTLNGQPGVFMTQIAFASNRSGSWEIYLMDWDGANQRRITNHNSISILPSWAPDNERMVYTSWGKTSSDLYIVNRRGGGRTRLLTRVGLNVSATFSPVGNDIAFVGSTNGNPDIYLIKDDGTNVRRLTSSSSIESTPEWSPNGRQISFTSGRSGTPQIYIMDAEGSNVRRISFDGDWNDDATWSPDGERIAYTSRVSGRFQIRIFNVVTGQSRIVAGEGSNEQPSWSPDGQWISFQSNRSGKWQVYRMRADGTDLLQLTFDGENKEPDWSKKRE